MTSSLEDQVMPAYPDIGELRYYFLLLAILRLDNSDQGPEQIEFEF